jgi:hypothetical protein
MFAARSIRFAGLTQKIPCFPPSNNARNRRKTGSLLSSLPRSSTEFPVDFPVTREVIREALADAAARSASSASTRKHCGGRLANRKACERFACAAAANDSGYREPGQNRDRAFRVGLPPWAIYQLQDRDDAGEFNPARCPTRGYMARGRALLLHQPLRTETMGILNIVPAERAGAHLLIQLYGPPRSGKTYTALRIARGMVAPRAGSACSTPTPAQFPSHQCDGACWAGWSSAGGGTTILCSSRRRSERSRRGKPIEQTVGTWRPFVSARNAYRRVDMLLNANPPPPATITLAAPEG